MKFLRLYLFICLSLALQTRSVFAFNPLAAPSDYYLPPEYSAVQAVLVSQVVLEDENGYQLLKVLISAGVQVWLLAERERLSDIQTHLREVYGLSQAQLSKLHLVPLRTNTLWARDWAPLMLLPRQAQLKPTKPLKPKLRLLDANYALERQLDEAVAAKLLDELQQFKLLPGWQLSHQALPLWLEGGNLACWNQTCLLGESILHRNPDLSAQQIISILTTELDQQIQLLPALPYESTGHLDIWLKPLNEDVLIVSQLKPSSLELAPAAIRPLMLELQSFLDQQALTLQQTFPDIQILRVPMPLPEQEPEGQMSFRTYTNSLLINGLAILPRYTRSAYGRLYRDQKLMVSYEAEVERVYRQAGYQPVWLEADYLIPGGGAWHCAAMQVPDL